MSASEDEAGGALTPADEPEWLLGEAQRRDLRRRGLLQLALLIPAGAFMLTLVDNPVVLVIVVLTLLSGAVRIVRQMQGLETATVGESEQSDRAVTEVLREGGLPPRALVGLSSPEEFRLAVQDQMDLIEPGEGSWWGRGRWLGPVLTGTSALAFFGLGARFWFTRDWPLLAWGAWTLGVGMLVAGGIHIWEARRRERALDVLAAQLERLTSGDLEGR